VNYQPRFAGGLQSLIDRESCAVDTAHHGNMRISRLRRRRCPKFSWLVHRNIVPNDR